MLFIDWRGNRNKIHLSHFNLAAGLELSINLTPCHHYHSAAHMREVTN